MIPYHLEFFQNDPFFQRFESHRFDPFGTSSSLSFMLLKGFAKVELAPGESREVRFELDARDFSFYDSRQARWIAESGAFDIGIGASSADIRLKETIELAADTPPRGIRVCATIALWRLVRQGNLRSGLAPLRLAETLTRAAVRLHRRLTHLLAPLLGLGARGFELSCRRRPLPAGAFRALTFVFLIRQLVNRTQSPFDI